MKRQLKQGIQRVVFYEVSLPLAALEWCRRRGFAPFRIDEEPGVGGHIFQTLAFRFKSRKAARRFARNYDLANNGIEWSDV